MVYPRRQNIKPCRFEYIDSVQIVISKSKIFTEHLLSTKLMLVLPCCGLMSCLLISWCDIDGGVNQALPFAQPWQTGGRRERIQPALTTPSWHFTFVFLAGGPVPVALFQMIVYFPVCIITSEDDLSSFIHSFIHTRNTYLLSHNSVSGIVVITMNKTKFQLSGRLCRIVPPSFYNSYFNDYKYTQKKVLMAGTFIIPKRQKALAKSEQEEERGIRPNSYSYS